MIIKMNLLVDIIIVLIFILACKIKKKINIKEYIDNFIKEAINFIWIPITCIILTKIINIQFNSEIKIILEGINKNSWLIISIILIALILECYIKYKRSVLKYIKYNLNNFMIGISVFYINKYILTLEVTNIWLTIFIVLLNIKVLFCLEDLFPLKNKNQINKMSEYVCKSYDELFPTRREQADNLINYIDSFDKNTRFSILINGEWGTGKTSLIKAIEDKVKGKYKMIFIQPMLFDQKDLLIKYFCERLKDVLHEEKIYTGKGSNIEAYLVSLLNLLNKKTNIGLKDIILNNESKDFRVIKKKLQDDIKRCINEKRIIVIVDDFDRVGTKIKKEILMFIRELIDFEGIDTILLMEYLKVIDEDNGLTKEYLDKYIDRTVELDSIEFKEMLRYFIDIEIKGLEFSFYKSKINYNQFCVIISGLYKLKKSVSLIRKSSNDSIKALNNMLSNNELKDENALYNYKEKTKELNELINNSYNNIRLIKKVIRDTILCYKELQMNYINKLILDVEDIIIIFKVNFIKNLFPEESVFMKNNDFDVYIKKNTYYNGSFEGLKYLFIKHFFSESLNFYIDEVKKINRYKIINAILKKNFKNINYESKSSNEKILNIIDNNSNARLLDNLLDLYGKKENLQQNIIHFYRVIFSESYSYESHSYESYKLIKKRTESLNNSLINFFRNRNSKLESLFKIYCELSSDYKQFFFIYDIIKTILKVSEENQYISNKSKDIIYSYIRESRINIYNHLIKIINIFLRCLDKKYIQGELVYSLEKMNKLIEVNFDISEIRIKNLDEHQKLECSLNYISKYLTKNKYLEKEEVDIIKNSINKLLETEEILREIDENIQKPIKAKDLFEAREVISGCKNYMEFEYIANCYINDMLCKKILDVNDLNILWGINLKIEEFIHQKDINKLIENFKKVLEKLKENKYPADYNYIDIINLRISIDKIMKRIKPLSE